MLEATQSVSQVLTWGDLRCAERGQPFLSFCLPRQFEIALDWDAFSIRIKQADMDKVRPPPPPQCASTPCVYIRQLLHTSDPCSSTTFTQKIKNAFLPLS